MYSSHLWQQLDYIYETLHAKRPVMPKQLLSCRTLEGQEEQQSQIRRNRVLFAIHATSKEPGKQWRIQKRQTPYIKKLQWINIIPGNTLPK